MVKEHSDTKRGNSVETSETEFSIDVLYQLKFDTRPFWAKHKSGDGCRQY